MALYHCQNAAANAAENANCGCAAVESESDRSCGCAQDNVSGACGSTHELLILLAICLLLIALFY